MPKNSPNFPSSGGMQPEWRNKLSQKMPRTQPKNAEAEIPTKQNDLRGVSS
jgi:hypothetical protein